MFLILNNALIVLLATSVYKYTLCQRIAYLLCQCSYLNTDLLRIPDAMCASSFDLTIHYISTKLCGSKFHLVALVLGGNFSFNLQFIHSYFIIWCACDQTGFVAQYDFFDAGDCKCWKANVSTYSCLR